ncbi:Tetraspanin-8 [Mactra antiquata]
MWVSGLLESAAIVLLVGGAAVLIIGFLGCCGAMKQSQCLLCLYAILLLLILIIELAAIVIAGVFSSQVEDKLKDFLKKNINSTYEGAIDTSEEFSLGLDYAQVYFACCGVDSFEEFHGATKWNRTTSSGQRMDVPPTCCKLKDVDAYLKDQQAELEDPNCPISPTQTNSNYHTPCWDSIKDYLKSRIALVIGIAAGILGLEIICVIFACCIISALRKEGK